MNPETYRQPGGVEPTTYNNHSDVYYGEKSGGGSSDNVATVRSFEYNAAAEARLRWKIDMFVVPPVSLFYLFCFIDRANIGNAKISGFETDIGLKGYDYNKIISIFYVSYILFEVPANVLCKWMGPGWFIPLATMLFGVMSLCTAYVNNFSQAAGVRFVLGIFEAGLFPGIAYYMSRWYRRSELTFRLSLYIVMSPLAGAFGGLLASGILKLPHVGGVRGWRMIFVVEGIITIGLGLLGFLILTDRPESARWLTEEEKTLAIERVRSERVATSAVLDKMDTTKLRLGIFNPVTLGTAFIFLLNNITVQGLAFFAPTIVATLFPHTTVVRQQLMTVPPYVFGAILTVFAPLLSWRYDRRMIFLILCCPLTMVGYAMFLGTENQAARYVAAFLVTSAFPFGALTSANVSANVVSDTARSAAIATNVMVGSIGGLISSWAFLPFDAPNYHIGNGLNLASASGTFLGPIMLLLWMKHSNRKRDRREGVRELSGMTQQQIEDLDWKHPDFRWKY